MPFSQINESHLIVASLGVALIILVLLYNKWQEYRYGKLAQKLIQSDHDDALLNEPQSALTPEMFDLPDEPVIHIRQKYGAAPENTQENRFNEQNNAYAEPQFSIGDAPLTHDDEAEINAITNTKSDDFSEDAAPVFQESAQLKAARAVVAREQISEPNHFLFPAIDYIVSFSMLRASSASEIFANTQAVFARLKTAVRVVGYNTHAGDFGEWEIIAPQGINEYKEVRFGLALANRQGALNEADLSAFCLCLQELAAQLTAVTNFPHRQSALSNALSLDDFCASVDIQIGVNVITQGMPFQGTKIRTLMEAAGMSIDIEGRFVRKDEEGNVLFALINQEVASFSAESMRSINTRGVTFLLDVPHVANGERVFLLMVERAKNFAEIMQGILVDDNRKVLNDASLEPIRAQIAHFQSIMITRGFSPGSPVTRRLFS